MQTPRRLALLFVVYATVSVCLIAVLMPPFQAADEFAHAQRADEIGLGGLIAGRNADRTTAGGIAHVGLDQLAAPFDPVRFHPERKVDAAMRLASATVPWGGTSWQPFPNTAIYPPSFYLPASAGFVAGRWLHLPVWHAVILSRLLGGFASILVAASAIALAGAGAPLLFALLCLPMTLALFAAISQDGLMIACASLGAVLLAGPDIDRRRFLSGCVLLALVAMGRPVYLPLCMIPLLAPLRSRSLRLGGAGLVVAATVFWVELSGRLVMPISSSAHIAEQLAAIRQHPSILRAVIRITVYDEWMNGLPVGREFIGVLGWLDTTLPNPYYALAGAMLLLAASASGDVRRTLSALRAALAVTAILLAIAAVYAVQYLSWSRIGSALLEGVQGRYFLPLAPLLIFVLPAWHRVPPRPVLLAIAVFPLLSIALTIHAIITRYYLG